RLGASRCRLHPVAPGGEVPDARPPAPAAVGVEVEVEDAAPQVGLGLVGLHAARHLGGATAPAEHAHERLLHEVLGRVPVAAQQVGRAVQPLAVLADEHAQGLLPRRHARTSSAAVIVSHERARVPVGVGASPSRQSTVIASALAVTVTTNPSRQGAIAQVTTGGRTTAESVTCAVVPSGVPVGSPTARPSKSTTPCGAAARYSWTSCRTESSVSGSPGPSGRSPPK